MRDKQIQQKIVQAFDNAAPEIPGVAPASRGTWEEPTPSRRAAHPVLRWAMVAAAAVLVFFCGFAVVHAWKASPSTGTVQAAALLPTATAVPVVTSAPDPVQMSVKQPPATTVPAPTQSPAPTATVLERGEVRRIILSHAEVAAESVQQWFLELDRENGRPVYEVEFTANSAEYEYEIDAITGEILKSERELLQPILQVDVPAVASTPLDIGRDEALNIALQHAGVQAEQAQRVRVEADRENGRAVYEVNIVADGYEYEYEVDAFSGEILKSERELQQQPVREDAPAVATTPRDVGREEALSIALQHAGIQAEQAQRVRAEADREDGRNVYEVEFTADGIEYDYEIDAATGEVLKSEREKTASSSKTGETASKTTTKPTSASTTKSVGQDDALSIALKNAGIDSSQAKKVRVEKDRENGRTVYEVEFTADGIEYDYEIDAATGEVLKSEREKASSSSKTGRSTSKSTAKPTAKPTAKTTNKATAKPTAKATAKPTAKPTDASTTNSIGRDEALSIALKNAGINSSHSKKVKVEKDRENGRTIYEVEFTAGGYEYEYEIDASSGKILKKEKDRDDD